MRRGTIAQALQSGPPAGKNPWGIHAGDGLVRHIASADAGVWTSHPGRGWDVPTEALTLGNYGFTVESGAIVTGAQLGEKISFVVNASSAPVIRWRCFGDNPAGEFPHPWTVAIKASVAMSGTLDNATELLVTTCKSDDSHDFGGGIVRAAGVWRTLLRKDATDTQGSLTFSEAHLVAAERLYGVQWAARLGVTDQNFFTAWVSPSPSVGGVYAHASADSTFGGLSSATARMWCVDTANLHPGGGAGNDATVTIHSVMMVPHPNAP